MKELVLPNAEDISGNPNSPVFADHNVVDLLLELPEETSSYVVNHYEARGGDHLTVGTTVLLPISDLRNINKWIPIKAHKGKKAGTSYVLVSPDENQLPFDDNTPVVHMPYFVTEKYRNKNYWGPHPDHVHGLKNKRLFFENISRLSTNLGNITKDNGWGEYVTLPYEIATGRDNVLIAIANREEEVSVMYDIVLNRLVNSENFASADILADYQPAVMFRMTTGDGGFGSGSIRCHQNGSYEVSIESAVRQFDSRDKAYQYLYTELRPSEYIVTRKIDVAESPSIGVYFRDGHFQAMPATVQFIKGEGCVGGGSQNIAPVEKQQLIKAAEPTMQQIATKLASVMTDGGVRHGHIGFDFIVGGEKERILYEAVHSDPDLAVRFGNESNLISVVESNPRFTSLSLTVQPFVRYELQKRAKRNGHITGSDLSRWYGQPDEKGRQGGFAVWDYVELPGLISSERKLIEAIENFNQRFEDSDIIMIPRLPLEFKEGKIITSVALGMMPTANSKSHDVFRELVIAVSKRYHLEDINI